ncbi:hypothetical protein C8B47_03625 [filamentous cyanobacterium CCP4]|nr:hypothetical protein C8B47_03625 [filamentous cyanobacterium CCP4]
MNTYIVSWQTSKGPGITFYRGKESVQAEDAEQAADLAQRNVHRRAFREFYQSHIIITKVERK